MEYEEKYGIITENYETLSDLVVYILYKMNKLPYHSEDLPDVIEKELVKKNYLPKKFLNIFSKIVELQKIAKREVNKIPDRDMELMSEEVKKYVNILNKTTKKFRKKQEVRNPLATDKSLVGYDANHYKYPNTLLGGIPPIENDLSFEDKVLCRQWLKKQENWSHYKSHELFRSFEEKSYDKLLQTLIKKHGVFTERFFNQLIRESVIHKSIELNINLQKLRKLICRVFRTRYYESEFVKSRLIGKDITFLSKHIYGQTLLRVIKNPKIHSQLERWYEKFKEPRKCALCGNKFRLIDLPDWIYFGSNGYKNCCFQCPIMETPTKKEMFKLIPSFVDSCGFIPASSCSPITYSFTSRIPVDKWAEVTLNYAKMGNVAELFGSWFEALAETRVLPDGVLVTTRGVKCLAQDGHVCLSLDEQYIDNWLFVHGIPHEREPHYPVHPKLNPAGGRRADWKIGDIFIEYFGLIGDEVYEKKMNEKIYLAQLLKITLICIYPSDLGHLEDKLGCLLKLNINKDR